MIFAKLKNTKKTISNPMLIYFQQKYRAWDFVFVFCMYVRVSGGGGGGGVKQTGP